MVNFGNHVCGCYYILDDYQRIYLTPVKLNSHTTINPVSFTTQLHQTFETVDAVERLRYTFPLYDGVAVSAYTVTYADNILTGVVKQKHDAQKTYQAAADRGQAAGLLESLPAGIFGVTLANVPAHTALKVEITYCGELKHDAAVDGLRYTLPTSIAPRYGAYPGSVLDSNVSATHMSITVDVDMGNSAIRKVQSPSHPIGVTMGELSTLAGPRATTSELSTPAGTTPGTAAFSTSQASATLSQGSTELHDDFVLQVVIDDHSNPQAVLEIHPTLPNQRAIMTTLVPKFVLESANPEIVFIADQSGSMSGAKNTALVSALRVFLKSLPLGVRFNICAFGNDYQFLWNSSQAYSEENVDCAIEFVNSFRAHFGGTELLKPIKAAFERHLKDMPLELMVLTDGEIWRENEVFQYINDELASGVDARVFALGIGQDVSHTLVEGIARAGNGFAQFVTQNEDTDQKVVRMLKGALYSHTKDYSLEVNYHRPEHDDKDNDDDDFEIVEKVQDCLRIATTDEKVVEPVQVKSFFDASADVDQPHKPQGRYAHLPSMRPPKLLQAPYSIPPLFPFNRSTVYLLLDESASRKNVKSVTLRARSANGALELEIPVSGTTQATSIHQLAARKAIQELEEGRGWIHSAEVEDGDKELVKQKYASRFDELVEREAVRLGEKFQVASKWTSFVAVQANGSEEDTDVQKPQQHVVRTSAAFSQTRMRTSRTGCSSGAMAARRSAPSPTAGLFGSSSNAIPSLQATSRQTMQSQQAAQPLAEMAEESDDDMGFGACSPSYNHAEESDDDMGFGASSPSYNYAEDEDEEIESDDDMGFGLFDGASPPKKKKAKQVAASKTTSTNDGLHEIINLQKFSGAWTCDSELLSLLSVTEERLLSSLQGDRDAAATALTIVYLEAVFKAKEDVWEMVAKKARTWLEQKVGGQEKAVQLLDQAKKLLP